MTRGQVEKALTIGERLKLQAMQRQQGQQWRSVVNAWWNEGFSYYGTDTNPDLMDKLKEMCESDTRKIPYLG